MTRSHVERALKTLGTALRHPLALVSLPVAMLLASRLGGEPALIAAAVLVAAALGAVRIRGAAERYNDRGALPGPQAFDAYLGKVLRAETRARTACLLIRIDDAAELRAGLSDRRYDRLLRLLAMALRPVLRDDDAIARIDRDTLAVALSPGARLTVETVIQTALRLQRRLDMPVDPGAGLVQVGTRIGLSLSRAGDSAARLSARARAALEQAEPGAIRCAEADAAPDTAVAVELARDLPEALRSGQITAFFQPQICLQSGVLSGVETLARWDHPGLGLLAPGQFLKTVEAADMMGALTEAMLSNALASLAEWDRMGLVVPKVSVNFALCDLSDSTLVERIEWMLDAAEIAPERLGIEVLESVLNLEGDEAVSQTLWRLRKLGCFIDLDDFGTGNTSIANIRRFAVQRLKIDRSFVHRVDRDPEQRAMVNAILTMAAQLRLDTLAEGAETAGEQAALAELGCRHVQGFGIGRPMPADRLPAWIAERSPQVSVAPEALRRLPPDMSALRSIRAGPDAVTPPVAPRKPRGGRGKSA